MTLKEIIKLHESLGISLIKDGIHYFMDNGKVTVFPEDDFEGANIKLMPGVEIIADEAFDSFLT